MIDLQKIKKYWLKWFILLLPFIDFFTSICTWEGISFSLGLLLKGLFLVYATIYLVKHSPKKKILYFLGGYSFLYFIYMLYSHSSLRVEIINLVKIFYLPILILFFHTYKSDRVSKKTLVLVSLFYFVLYLFPFFFGLGHNIREIYPNKELYLSYFYIGNELSNVFILLTPVVVLYLLESHSYLLKGLFILLYLCTIFLMSTKTFYASLFLIFVYFLIHERTSIVSYLKKKQIAVLGFFLAFFLFLVVTVPKMDLVQNIKTQLEHYEVDTLQDMFQFQNIDHVIYSNRLTFLKQMHEEYKNSPTQKKVFGLGRSRVDEIKNVEIDIFDIFYSIGWMGFIIYLLFFFYVLKISTIKSVYKFSFYLLLCISFFTGHVLLSPFTSTFLALLFLVSKNNHGKMKKDILFVTNMYPSEKYPHYGIFVKNSYELLEKNHFSMDFVGIYKTNGMKKLFSYVKLYGISFLKAVFNNYDFIYVHFVSHTTIGVFLPYLCSKNTLLVLNVHGNDVVADTKEDTRHLFLSRLFLRFSDQVIVPSYYFQSILEKEYHIPKERLVVYPSGGVDLTKFQKMDQKEAIHRLGLDSTIHYFGYVSRIEKDKGYDVLLQAIHILKQAKKLKQIKFIVVGSGREEEIFNHLVSEYKLAPYLIRKPLVNQEELVIIYNAMEALIYPTRRKSESLGLTGLEAMACETLVIGGDKFGPSDYLENKKNALCFPVDNAKILSEKIEEVLAMADREKGKMKREARKRSEAYSFSATELILVQVFKKK